MLQSILAVVVRAALARWSPGHPSLSDDPYVVFANANLQMRRSRWTPRAASTANSAPAIMAATAEILNALMNAAPPQIRQGCSDAGPVASMRADPWLVRLKSLECVETPISASTEGSQCLVCSMMSAPLFAPLSPQGSSHFRRCVTRSCCMYLRFPFAMCDGIPMQAATRRARRNKACGR
jgi:hypothetical protein